MSNTSIHPHLKARHSSSLHWPSPTCCQAISAHLQSASIAHLCCQQQTLQLSSPLLACVQKSSSPSPNDPPLMSPGWLLLHDPMKKQAKPFTRGAGQRGLPAGHRPPSVGFHTALSTRDQSDTREIISHNHGAINHQTHKRDNKYRTNFQFLAFFLCRVSDSLTMSSHHYQQTCVKNKQIKALEPALPHSWIHEPGSASAEALPREAAPSRLASTLAKAGMCNGSR